MDITFAILKGKSEINSIVDINVVDVYITIQWNSTPLHDFNNNCINFLSFWSVSKPKTNASFSVIRGTIIENTFFKESPRVCPKSVTRGGILIKLNGMGKKCLRLTCTFRIKQSSTEL